jgi:superfamily II DNA/RNA helicase
MTLAPGFKKFQIHENIEYFASYLKAEGYRAVKSCLAIGGVPSSEALEIIRRGVHILVATPGRLMDMLNKKMVNLDVCRYLCLDEAGKLAITLTGKGQHAQPGPNRVACFGNK